MSHAAPFSNTTKMRLHLDGLSCASCVSRAETAIAALDGVEQATVNLATGAANVTFGAPATPTMILSATAGAGYPGKTDTMSLTVQGATCASCVLRIETAMAAVPGVVDASMNLATGQARVRVLGDQVRASDLGAAIQAVGYSVISDAPATLTARRDQNAEDQRDLWRATTLSLILSLPIFIAEMGGHLVPSIHAFITQTIGLQTSWLIQFALATAVLAIPGRRFFARGVPALLRGAPDMNSLVALGASAAWAYSTLATFAPNIMPAGTRAVYFESATVIVTLILLGRWLEMRAKGRAGEAIRHLVALSPDTADVQRDGRTQTIPLDQVRPGDILELKPGARVAVDGVVVTGHSFVDESMLSGEPMAVEKSPDDPVIGGTINQTGALSYRATAVGADTVLAHIIEMVEDAQGSKLPIQAVVDRITAWFVPAVLAAAALTVVVWMVLGPDPAAGLALVAGVSVLIIACPCAMGLATPTSIMVGTGRAAELGVLFRQGDALQRLQNADVIALDKTGTLTMGQPHLTDMVMARGQTEAQILPLLASVQARSEHPIGRAIVQVATDKGMIWPDASDFKSLTGQGVQATVDGTHVLIGADHLMASHNIEIGDLARSGAAQAKSGKTPLYAALNGTAVAAIAVSDPIKPTTPAAIKALQNEGLRVVMLTGDNADTARAIAAQLGIDDVQAGLSPQGKAAAIATLRENNQSVAFVGDGINDAPALAAADIGLAVGDGTDIAIQSADVVLINGNLAGVLTALNISRATMTNVRQNLFWAFAYNAALIPVAAGVLYPVAGLMLSPAIAAGAMALSSVVVVTNALRLRKFNPTPQSIT